MVSPTNITIIKIATKIGHFRLFRSNKAPLPLNDCSEYWLSPRNIPLDSDPFYIIIRCSMLDGPNRRKQAISNRQKGLDQ